MSRIKKIGVLTSGGDCPGLNAVIRGVALHANETYGWDVVGIREAHHGLLRDPPDTIDLTPDIFRGDLLRAGGTFLGTTTSGDPFEFPSESGVVVDRSKDIVAAIQALEIDALVVIGGDGSMRIFGRLLEPAGIPWVGIPKTIDNDVPGTDYAVGFATAVEVVGSSLDRLQSTAASHRRVMILETMGRQSGFISLYGGVAGGADVILIPERTYDLDALLGHIDSISGSAKGHILMTVAEGVRSPQGERVTMPYYGSGPSFGGVGTVLAEEISTRIDGSARCTVLGHLQRGGSPIMFDRLLASSLSVRAVNVLGRGDANRMAAWRSGRVIDVPLDEVVNAGPRSVAPDNELLVTAEGLGTYVGTANA